MCYAGKTNLINSSLSSLKLSCSAVAANRSLSRSAWALRRARCFAAASSFVSCGLRVVVMEARLKSWSILAGSCGLSRKRKPVSCVSWIVVGVDGRQRVS